jgi:C-terminal processing protease CtpA/Prc
MSRLLIGAGALALAGSLAGLGLLWVRLERLAAENRALRAEAGEARSLREANARLQRLEADADELQRLRRDTQEIHKLRAQHQDHLRRQEQLTALERENEQLKAANQQLTAQHQALRGQVQSLVTAGANPAPAAAVAPNPSAWLGVSIQSLSDLPQARSQAPGLPGGVVVTLVIPNGPAEGSGLQAGDIITALDGKPVLTAQQLRDEMRTRQIGQRVVADVYRNGLVYKVGVNAAPFPAR